MRNITRKPGLFLLVLALSSSPEALLAQRTEEPLAVALRFARAFEKKDFATIRSLLTEDAVVLQTSLSRTAAPKIFRSPAREWADKAEGNHAALRDLRLEILESAASLLEQGAVVSLRYQFTGKAGKASFLSDGIDTYFLIRVQGTWRILQYSYIERLEILS